MKTVKFFTLGCKANQYDTQLMRENFARASFLESDNGRKADVYVINTCTVTETADNKSRYYIRYARRHNPKAKIIVTGCYAELDASRIKEIDPAAGILKNRDKHKVLDLCRERHRLISAAKPYQACISSFYGHSRAFLKIQDGCNNRCSYCKVPLVRGKSRSRRIEGIIREASCLAENGFKEIVLTGICLGAYGKDLRPWASLAQLIAGLEKIPRLLRIRLSSIEAADVSQGLIKKMADSEKVCKHLHIPFQSGDNEILKKMNRRYSYDKYLSLIRKLKDSIPGIAITTDMIVGFPQENEQGFENSLKLIKETLPLKVHIFPFSPRKGTPAYGLDGAQEEKAVTGRIARLKQVADECSRMFRERFLNKRMAVLIEGRVKSSNIYWEGFTGNYIKVWASSMADLKNEIVTVRLKKVFPEYVLAELPK